MMENTKYPVDCDILENSYVDKMAYANFLFEQERNTLKLNAFISECLCIAGGGDIYKGIKAINEGISDKAESAWDKVMDFLRRMWGKFVENMTRLFNTNGYYLEKYKDIIIKKPIKFTEKITMPNYFNGIKNITNTRIPQITVSSLDQIPTNTEDSTGMNVVRTSIMPAWKNAKPSDNPYGKEFKAWAVDFFKGLGNGEVDFTASQINMTDVYNFCHDSKNITSILEKDKSAIERASKEFADEVKNAMNKAEKDGEYSNSAENGASNKYDAANGETAYTNGSNYTYTITVDNQVKTYNAVSKQVDGKWGVYLGSDYPGNKTLISDKLDSRDPNFKKANPPKSSEPKPANEQPANPPKSSEPKPANEQPVNPPKSNEPKPTTEQYIGILRNGAVFSRVLGTYITEDNSVTFSGNGNSNNANTNTTVGGNNGTTAAAANRAASADANNNGRYNANNAVNVKSTDKTIEEKANVWLGIATETVTAKMTAVEAINNAFMQIIKNHVQYYVGRANIENDQAPRQGTNYNNNQNNNQQSAPTGGEQQAAAAGGQS